MILILAGTTEGRLVAEKLQGLGLATVCSVVSDYGEVLLKETGIADVVVHRLDENSMPTFIQKHQIQAVVDATHPFAVNISQLAIQVCQHLDVAYYRYQRALDSVPNYPGVHVVRSYQEAAQLAAKLGSRWLLTTGSNHLELFVKVAVQAECEVIARVLPEPSVLTKCRDLGLLPRQIIAIQGPFSHALNCELIRHSEAQVLITKHSGDTGGFWEKISAAQESKVPVIVILPPSSAGLASSHTYTNMDILAEQLKQEYSTN